MLAGISSRPISVGRLHSFRSAPTLVLPNIGGVRWHEGWRNKKIRVALKKRHKQDKIYKDRRKYYRAGHSLKYPFQTKSIKKAFSEDVRRERAGWDDNDPLLEIYPTAELPEPLTWENRYEVTADPYWMMKNLGRARDNLRLAFDETQFRLEKRRELDLTQEDIKSEL